MYRAVQDQLESSGEEDVQDYTELRQETASYMRAFPDKFMPFIVQARLCLLSSALKSPVAKRYLVP